MRQTLVDWCDFYFGDVANHADYSEENGYGKEVDFVAIAQLHIADKFFLLVTICCRSFVGPNEIPNAKRPLEVWFLIFDRFSSYFNKFCRESFGRESHKNKIYIVREKNFSLKLFDELYNDLCDAVETINSTFTLHLVFVMTSFLASDVFAAYGILREYLSGSKRLLPIMLGNFSWMAIQYSIKVLSVHAGSSTSNEAERTIIIIARTAGTLNPNDSLKSELDSFSLHMRCRNKKLENVFFFIDWTLILVVNILSP